MCHRLPLSSAQAVTWQNKPTLLHSTTTSLLQDPTLCKLQQSHPLLSCPPNYCPQDRETAVLLRQPLDLSNKTIISFACMYGVRERDLGPAKKVRLLRFRVLQFWQVSPTTCSHCLLTQQPVCCYKNPSPGWCMKNLCTQLILSSCSQPGVVQS